MVASNSYETIDDVANSSINSSFLYKLNVAAGFDGADEQVMFAGCPCLNGIFGSINVGSSVGGANNTMNEINQTLPAEI